MTVKVEIKQIHIYILTFFIFSEAEQIRQYTSSKNDVSLV